MLNFLSRKQIIWVTLQLTCLLFVVAFLVWGPDRGFLLYFGICLWLIVSMVLSVFYLTHTFKPWREIRQNLSKLLKRQGLEIPNSTQETDDSRFIAKGIDRLNTAIEQGNQKLTQSVEQFNAVVEGMSDGIVAIDQNRNILLGNDACWQMLSLTQEDLIGRNFLEVCRIPQLHNLITEVLETEHAASVEFETMVSPRRILLAQATQLRHRGEFGLTVVFRDVTEIRQLETMRRDFFTNASHELKTPLAAIKLYAETLRLGAVNDKEKNVSFVEQIEISADRLGAQIQDLLDLSRVESGQATFDLAPVDLYQACKNCVERFASSASAAEILIKIEEPENQILALADDEGIQTILNNLVSNAIRYTPAGGQITMKVYRDNQNAVLEVADTGIGIPSDKLDRVFERFYRVDKARSREAGGSGIGLSIVKHLAQTFGGSVKLTSQIGRGSVFRINLKHGEFAASQFKNSVESSDN